MRALRNLAAGVAMAASLGIAVASGPAAAASTAAAPRAAHSYRTWRAAQKAAGFALLRPRRTYGLREHGGIKVGPCQVTGEQSKTDVLAGYGRRSRRWLSIDQNNSGQPCGNVGVVTLLGHYRVHGVRATLSGVCGKRLGLPPCSSRKIWLFLNWAKRGVYYQAASHDEWRSTIVGFARKLRRVG